MLDELFLCIFVWFIFMVRFGVEGDFELRISIFNIEGKGLGSR